MPDIHIHVDNSGDPSLLGDINRKLDAVLEGLAYNIQQEEQTMLDLTALQEQVAEDTSIDESIKALIINLADQIAAAPDQAAIDAIVDGMRSNNGEMAEIVVANTPAAEPPVDEPPVDEPPMDV